MLDRFKLFHQIITESDPTSPDSILFQATVNLVNETGSQRGAWFYGGVGGLLCKAAVSTDQDGFDATRHFPMDVIKDSFLNGERSCTRSPETAGSHRQSHFLCLPKEIAEGTYAILCLERVGSGSFFYEDEADILDDVLADVIGLVGSSNSYERQQFELDRAQSQLAMNQVGLISKHPNMLKLFALIRKLSCVPSTVLIQGESGTGKELVARAIYKLGNYQGPFIGINCGGIEPNLMKSELFGHVKGSFTGADKHREGYFKKAEGGVLFMDEIGEMPMDMQVALLRTLELSEIIPVGGDTPEKVNTRVIAATHRDLAQMVEDGTFRNDLYQRIRGLSIVVPPLRERISDVKYLCAHFVEKYNNRFGLSFKGLKPEAMDFLERSPFREGNIRELEHIIERAMVFEDNSEWIGLDYLERGSEEPSNEAPRPGPIKSFEDAMNQYASQLIQAALDANDGNKSKAMRQLGLSRSTFYSHLNRLNIK